MRCISSTITAEQSTFTGNSVACDGTHARTVGMGGAIWAQFTNLKIIGSTFSNNLAVQNGGAVYAFGSSVSVQGSRFISNSAPGGTFTQGTGGALYLDSIRNSQVNINQSDFTNNSKVAVYISGGSSRDNDYDVIISNCTFTRSSGGRAVHVRYVTSITVIGSSFASNDGGGLYATGNDITFLLEESTFSDNVARQCVAIEVEGNNQHINFSSGNTFTYNRIGDGFSARSKVVCVKNAFMSVANSTFSHNWISGTFGVLYATSSNVSIQGSDFYNNTATNGAAIYVTACSLFINQSRFTSNTASSGGALFVSRGNVTLHQCSFTSNSAVQEMGEL